MSRLAGCMRDRRSSPVLMLRTWSAMVFLAFGGCATDGPEIEGSPSEAVRLDHHPFLYVIVDRDRRLPAAFTTTFETVTRNALPGLQVAVAEDRIDAKEVARADWVMTVRAARIIPHYTFTPSAENALNGLTDCIVGSAVLVGLSLAPCLIQGDEDVLDAEIRDAQSRLLRRYHFEEAAGGFTLVPPLTYLSNRDESERWEKLGKALCERLKSDRVFDFIVHSEPGRARSARP